ncbi:MAG TPA: hypothetical protein PLM62_20090, partial [Zoogloea sp.]|nr:hypothetical protein [Zoogloea sp.]
MAYFFLAVDLALVETVLDLVDFVVGPAFRRADEPSDTPSPRPRPGAGLFPCGPSGATVASGERSALPSGPLVDLREKRKP